MKLIVNGARGRMGRMVVEAAARAGDEVVALVDRADHPEAGLDIATPWGARTLLSDGAAAGVEADAAIDFSLPDVSVAFARAVAGRGIPIVCGTTGVSDAHLAALEDAAAGAPILWTANTSIGVFCLHELCAMAQAMLGPSYDVEIVEIHHRHKRDAPSGTALSLSRRLVGDRLHVRASREGDCGPRAADELGVLAVRGGEVVGEHTVYFFGDHDRIELTHRATSRVIFAEGAVALARRLIGRGPGLLRVEDVLRGPA